MGWCCALRIGVSDLHYGSGAVCMNGGGPIGLTQTGITAEDMGAAVLATEDGSLGEYCQTADGTAAAVPGGGISQNPVVECNINTIMIAVKSYRFYFDCGIQKLGAAHFCSGTVIQNCLRAGG